MLLCKWCNSEFEKKGKKVFCNKKCNVDYWSKQQSLKIKDNPELKKKKMYRSRLYYRKKHKLDLNVSVLFYREKGSGTITKTGYRCINKIGHPNASKTGRILEHQYIMSQHLGRPIFKHEMIHHKNGNRLDNRIENLELWSKSHPSGQRINDKIEWCKEFLEIYGYDVIKR